MTNEIEPLNGSADDEIDLVQLLSIIWNGKIFIFFITMLFTISGVFYALSLPNIYRAEALLSPVNDENGSGNSLLSGQLGGLANLAGVNLGSSQTNHTIKALATIQSRDFLRKFFAKHELLVPFMAAKASGENGRVEIDPDLYDTDSAIWVREVGLSGSSKPSDLEVYREFSRIFSISQDEETGLITLALEWYDPVQIKQWVDWLIEDLNLHMKEKDANETGKAISYLQDQLESTSLVEMKSVFYNLIESQTQKAMLVNIKDEYSFEQIDPATVSEKKIRPRRPLIVLLMFLLGGIFGLIITLVKRTNNKKTY